jgi:hypothetical protein
MDRSIEIPLPCAFHVAPPSVVAEIPELPAIHPRRFPTKQMDLYEPEIVLDFHPEPAVENDHVDDQFARPALSVAWTRQ